MILYPSTCIYSVPSLYRTTLYRDHPFTRHGFLYARYNVYICICLSVFPKMQPFYKDDFLFSKGGLLRGVRGIISMSLISLEVCLISLLKHLKITIVSIGKYFNIHAQTCTCMYVKKSIFLIKTL